MTGATTDASPAPARGVGAKSAAPDAIGKAGSALDLRGLVKRYGDLAAVNHIDLTVPAGEFVTLLGPSGSGKTTTLNMIAGFADVDEGEILMDGSPIADVASHKRNIGVVFQHYALFPHMTAADNVAFPLKRRKVGRAEQRERVERALEMVRLGDFAGRYPRELSGGQQQRVALARSLVFEPRVLLMDEPLGALDKKLREWLQLEFKRIHRELGITFVYVTHDQEEALILSDRIAVFNDGRIEQVGTADELYEKPQTLFVAEFVGESNTFAGRVRRDGEGCALVGDGYDLRSCRSSASDGALGTLVVRPERVAVHRNGHRPDPSHNVLSGILRHVIYLGSARKLEVELPDQRSIVVREPASSADLAAVGDRITVSWSPEDSTLVPDQELTLDEDLQHM